METLFVVGKRTRSRCQATGAAAPVPMAASTSAEAGLRKERPTGAAGGAPSPHGAGVPRLLPQGPPRGQVGRWCCAPFPACPRVPVRGRAGRSGTRCPLHQRDSVPSFQLWFQPALLSGTCPCTAEPGERLLLARRCWGARGVVCRAPRPPSALLFGRWVAGGFHSPTL